MRSSPPVAKPQLAIGRARATSAACVTSRTAAPGVGALAQQVEDAVGGHLVELAGGLVGEQHFGVVGERDGQPGARQLAAGELRSGGHARGRRSRSARAARAAGGLVVPP